MIVEDEELILQGIRNILDWESLGLQVVHMAHDGAEALEMWEKEPVHIVVTDISMPEMDGLELLRRIREKEEQVRFIILTGYDEFAYASALFLRLKPENHPQPSARPGLHMNSVFLSVHGFQPAVYICNSDGRPCFHKIFKAH